MSEKNIVCRKCRRAGEKLFLKGDRCMSVKCSFARRSYIPGQHGTARVGKLSDFGVQLREKQKTKAIYGIRETQFSNYYKKASKTKQATGEKLLQSLEARLDNIVYRLGFAASRRQARQMVSHKMFLVNEKRVNIPSYQMKEKDKIEPLKKEGYKLFKTEIPAWLKLEKGKLVGEIVKIPSRGEIETNINEGLIVEFYSR